MKALIVIAIVVGAAAIGIAALGLGQEETPEPSNRSVSNISSQEFEEELTTEGNNYSIILKEEVGLFNP